jgi:UDP-N-acetylglucosamine 2-epimerase (non-hydrolysing)
MIEFEKVCLLEKPNLVVVVGDVNATIACALTACKLGIKVVHVEAGLRSNNRKMPEEINRVLTDAISDLLFVSEYSGTINLENEGVSGYKIHLVGNIMIDTLLYMWPKIKADSTFSKLGLRPNKYIMLTLHRPSNVDDKKRLRRALYIIKKIQRKNTVVWPIHPRTKKNIEAFGLTKLLDSMKHLIITEPLGYIEFMSLVRSCLMVITDSGGIQEETTFLKKPCITMREETERPSTIMSGFNILAMDSKSVINAYNTFMKKKRNGPMPSLWDGKTGERIVEIIYDSFKNGIL